MNIPGDLKVGAILLYATKDIVDDVIEWKEGDDIAHIEIYIGNGLSWASRNGIGVNEYPFRPEGLKYIRQPIALFNSTVALQWFDDGVKGLPYGFGDILETINVKNNLTGVDCSHFAACLMEAAGCPQFDPSFPKNKITPSDFKKVRESISVSF